MARTPTEPLKPLYPRWYNKNVYYDYHFGAQGHSTENCKALKYRVQALIKGGYLDFLDESKPNVTADPLPNHAGPNVNTIMEDLGTRIKIKVDEVYKALIEMAVIPEVRIF